MKEINQRFQDIMDMVKLRAQRLTYRVLRKPDPQAQIIRLQQLELPFTKTGMRR